MSLMKDCNSLKDVLSLKKAVAINSSSISAISCSFLNFIDSNCQVLWIVPQKEQITQRKKELATFYGERVIAFEPYEHYPFLPLIPSIFTSANRINTLYKLSENKDKIVVTEPRCLLEHIIPREKLKLIPELLIVGEEIDRDSLLTWLIETGFERVPKVKRIGEFSVRGDVIDIYNPYYQLPLRIVFFDDLIEDIRVFDPEDQRTVDRLDESILLPVREVVFFDNFVKNGAGLIIKDSKSQGWSASLVADAIQNLEHQRHTEATLSLMPFLYGKLGSIFDYLKKEAVLVFEEPFLIAKRLTDLFYKMSDSFIAQIEKGRLLHKSASYFQDLSSVNKKISEKKRVFLNCHTILNPADLELSILYEKPEKTFEIRAKKLELAFISPKGKKGFEIFGEFFSKLTQWQDEQLDIVFLAQSYLSLNRLKGILEHYNKDFEEISLKEIARLKTSSNEKKGRLYLARGFIQDVFLLEDKSLIFIPDHSLFAVPKEIKKRPKRKKDKGPISISDIREGELIVHRDFGIGRYLGLVKMTIGDVVNEFVHLEYHGGDKLYVPVDRLGLLQKYVGLEGKEPRLDRLGAKTWQNRKSKVKKKIKEIAHELVELYAIRKITKGVRLDPPDEMYRQFEMSFPFEETKDQKKVIQEILEDLQAEYPMDRLLCGDVGFGKTEVAMRAAFLTVQNGYQVAMLVPTTLLAEQHERTFKERFKDFPINIASLSRLKTRGYQRQIIEGVKNGEIDILIGTHRILQSDVFFKRLGLVIIDEEHRFGVKHKEKLKALTKEINCLSLTATPIPRTLQLSLLGIRDLSTLESPPKGRISIKTFLAEFDDSIIKEAIERELSRGGQVFFVHNRIKGIFKMAEHIQRLVKEARIDVAHGQMEADELEDKMIRFVRGDIDCLVCTTIIESGLDIPSANTLIINRADRFGIADLYQLRGRVGRSNKQAYAYLFVPDIDKLGKDASLRLKAIMETSELGGGMSLAMHDLKIRGAGNLLGIAQAGQISEVGYALYLDLLKEAIDAFKGKEIKERLEPEVNLGISAYIPEKYCPDVYERMELYRWFSDIEDEIDKKEIYDELKDRFGEVPEEVENLLNIMVIKSFLREINCLRLDVRLVNSLKLTFAFAEGGPRNIEKLMEVIQSDGRFKIMPEDKLVMEIKKVDEDGKVDLCKKVISLLKEFVKLTN